MKCLMRRPSFNESKWICKSTAQTLRPYEMVLHRAKLSSAPWFVAFWYGH